MDIKRIIKRVFTPRWAVTRMFPAAAMKAIENAIRESERSHDGELRFAVEVGLNLWLVLHERTPRARAIEIFSQLRVWDTEHIVMLVDESHFGVSLKRQVGSIRNTVIVVVLLLVGIAFAPGYYNVHQEEQHIQLIAKNMLSLPDPARSVINGHVARIGSLVGSGKGVAVPPNKMNTPSQELEWKVSDDGHILGLNNTFLKVTVEWTPAVQNSRVVWSCKVTFPERYSKLTPPPCPEIL